MVPVMPEADGALHVPAQEIPVPKSISREGQAFLAGAAKRIAAMPNGGDAAGLSRPSLADQAAAAAEFLRPMTSRFTGTFETIALPHGANLYRVTPDGRAGRKAQVAFLDIHGGGFVAGGGEMCQLLARIAGQLRSQIILRGNRGQALNGREGSHEHHPCP